MRFKVIDRHGTIVMPSDLKREEWASALLGDSDAFAVDDEGNLLLLGSCGDYVYCPPDMFQVVLT
jgi:hypothetical protein